MTDDLTDRLRKITVAEEIEECLLPDELVTLAEAADEIDRLRARLGEVSSNLRLLTQDTIAKADEIDRLRAEVERLEGG